MTRLQNGQAFPAFDVPAVGGGTISIRQSLQRSYGVVLIYRRAWCPYRQAQLAGGAGRQDPERLLFRRPARQIDRRGRHRHGRLSQIQRLSPRTLANEAGARSPMVEIRLSRLGKQARLPHSFTRS